MLKNVKKRLISIVATAAMLVSCMPVFTTAAEADYSHLLATPAVKPSAGGALKIIDKDGTKTLGDKNGNPIQLRGMSTHGLQWFPEILNDNAFNALSNDLGANVIRLAMYVGENGYDTDPATMKQRVIDGINFAIKNDMYVIVDWHVHMPGDPNASVYSGAMNFFKEISAMYPNAPHLIYEVANEPSSNAPGVTNDAEGWAAVKSYAEPIIKMLRDNGNQNLVIVGSPNWSQRPDLAADNPIDDSNTIYTVHFYSGTHAAAADSLNRQNVMSNARYALEHGVAVFASEWGTSEASGNNGPFLNEADSWLDFLNGNNISWCNWSLTNKNETSGSFTPFVMGKTNATSLDPGSDKVWASEELSVSGEYVRARIKGISYKPIDRTPKEIYNTVIWDFNNNTTQGFGVNSGSPVKDGITVTNENNALKLSGLTASKDTSAGGFWGNLRISADSWGGSVDLKGVEKLTMDVIASAPATVAIAAIPQAPSNGWWTNPAGAVQVTANDFKLQEDGRYKAVLTITKADAPGLEVIGTNADDSNMKNLVLFIGAQDIDVIYLDNIAVSGTRAVTEQPVVNAPLGTAALPSDFEDSTRQGWKWSGDSGVKTGLTIENVDGSKALSWEYSYPEVKPSDGWASAPRLDFWMDKLVLGDNKQVAFDLYMQPVRATKGAIDINLVCQPPSLGYWAQCPKTYKIQLDSLSSAEKTSEGLYHFAVKFDASSIPNLKADTELRNMVFVFADVDSDFAGRMYVDNVRFEKELTVSVGNINGGSITADPASALPGTTINLAVTPNKGFRLKEGSLKYNDGTKDVDINGTSFVMPSANVTITAEFERYAYVVNIGTFIGGTIKANLELAQLGDIIYLTKTADERYHMDPKSLKYYDGTRYVEIKGNHFTMPSADISITADFIKGSGKK
jgi:endoglucanase